MLLPIFAHCIVSVYSVLVPQKKLRFYFFLPVIFIVASSVL